MQRSLLPLAAVLVAFPLLWACHRSGPDAPPPEVPALVQAAEIHARAGEHAAAAAAWRKVVAATPEDLDARLSLGAQLWAADQPEAAVTAYREAVQRAPHDARAQGALGNALREIQRPGEALPSLQEAVALEPNDARLRWELGDVLLSLQRFPEAAEAFQRALALDPDFPPAHYGQGLTRLRQNDRAGALLEYQWLKTHDPKLADALFDSYRRMRGFKTRRRHPPPPGSVPK